MNQGIKSLKEAADLVMAFNSRIESITLIDNLNSQKTVYKVAQRTQKTELIQEVEVLTNTESNLIIMAQERLAEVAVKLDSNLGNGKCVLEKDKTMSTMFCDLPLIGSESVIFPCYVNSHIFWPNEERSMIVL